MFTSTREVVMTQELVGSNIQELKPYVPGKPIDELERELGITGSIKLASNENPLGPSPLAMEAVHEAVDGLHIYPDGAIFRLRERIAAFMGVDMDEVIIGNGSNEVLTMLVRTFVQPGETAVVSDYSFVAYRVVLKAADVPTTVVPMADGYVHDLEAMAAAVTDDTKVVFVANPNNPTGTHVGRSALETFLRKVPDHVIVVIDEAYVEYAGADDYTSAMPLRDLRERLVITRTFSKCYGLAGLRCGFGIAPAEMVGFMNRIREPFNANLLAQIGAARALDDAEFVARSVAANEEGRRILEAGLEALRELGVDWIPSQTNFLLVKTPVEGVKVYDAMLREGVIIRPMAGYGLHDFVRISIGTPAETERCVGALHRVVRALVEAA
jgi:histidinol-phosphate aminotransferase